MALTIGSLDRTIHDRKAFDCGKAPLNEFLQARAAKHQRQGVSRTFVLTDSSAPTLILGYYSLSNCQIARERLSPAETKALPRHPVPAILLARLAVDQGVQGKCVGLWLLMDAVKRCSLVAQQTGVYALVVDAKDNEAELFYRRFGFISIIGRTATLYLPLTTGLKALMAGPR